ncbi:hypothetical protein Geezett_065 [Klebsiella phage Geezett]|uniref:Uncharacterized protein n=1 Tax=Klebsiella phage Geezett TaxID=2861002 RepID=A0AAE8B1P9_9CAUD|nr:hypothetical protein PQZ59_gp65 [Klebsiella phage Geezett]QXV72137.1 hypothetical protein Geezett_065 [Klebsiella phage Geezett]
MKIKQLLRPSYGWYNSVKWFLDDVQIPMYVAHKLIRKARMVESNNVRKVWEM